MIASLMDFIFLTGTYDHGIKVISASQKNKNGESMEKVVSKSCFKPQALKYFRQIQESGHELIITDHSKPVLKIIPFQEGPQEVLKELRNSVKRYDDPLQPVAQDEWEALK